MAGARGPAAAARKGCLRAEAQQQAMQAHPTWYEAYRHEVRGRYGEGPCRHTKRAARAPDASTEAHASGTASSACRRAR